MSDPQAGDGLPQVHVFDIRLDFDVRRRAEGLPGGAALGLTLVADGLVSGPRLNGRVLPHSGGDWANVRADGVVELNAHYVIEADDGALIHLHNRGYVVPGDSAAQPPRATYFRVTPFFRAPIGQHDWLNRTVVIGSGERRSEPDHSLFRYYALI